MTKNNSGQSEDTNGGESDSWIAKALVAAVVALAFLVGYAAAPSSPAATSVGDGGEPSVGLTLLPIEDDVSNDATLKMNFHPTDAKRVAVMERDVAGEETVWWASTSQSLSLRDERVHNGSTIIVLAVAPEAGTVRELERYRVSSGDGNPELVSEEGTEAAR